MRITAAKISTSAAAIGAFAAIQIGPVSVQAQQIAPYTAKTNPQKKNRSLPNVRRC